MASWCWLAAWRFRRFLAKPVICSCTGPLLTGFPCLVQSWYQETVNNIYGYYNDMATYFWNNQFRKDVASAINGEHR